MIIKIKIDTEEDSVDSRFSVRPILSEQEMEKVEAAANELGKDVASVLVIMDMIVYDTFYNVGVASGELAFDDLLKTTKERVNYSSKEKGEKDDV